MKHPSCFGIPSVFSFKSETCGSCASRDDCRSTSYSKLLNVADHPIAKHLISVHQQHQATEIQVEPIDVSRPIPVSLKRSSKRELTLAEVNMLASMPKKVCAYLKSIWTRSKDVEMGALFERGLNPFDPDSAKPYYLAFETMSNGRATREMIVKSLMTNLGWSYSAAHSQASMIGHVLPALGFASWDGAFLRKHPNNQR